jgi:hypothetical protein
VKLGSGVSGRRAAAGAPLKILRRRRRQTLNGAPPPPINKGRRAAAEQMASARTSNEPAFLHLGDQLQFGFRVSNHFVRKLLAPP